MELRKSSAQTSTERSRKFRAEKKASEKSISQNSILHNCPSDKNNLDENSSLPPGNPPKCLTRRKYKPRNNGFKKSAAQRSREYRLRKKASKKCAVVQNQTDTDSSVTTVSFNEQTCFVKYEVDISDDDLNTSQPLTSYHRSNNQNDEHDSGLSYSDDNQHSQSKEKFTERLDHDAFEYICCLCDESWFKEDFKYLSEHKNISNENVAVCNTCKAPLNEYKLPMMSNIIFLSEICLDNYDDAITPKLKCFVKLKPSDNTGGSINRSQYDMVNIITPSIEMVVTQSESYTSTCHPSGEICIAECAMTNGKLIIIATIYITPNIKIDDMIYFIHRSLLVYSHEAANIFMEEQDKLPLILSGNFNINFASEDSTQLVNFLRDKFSLFENNELTTTTTEPGYTFQKHSLIMAQWMSRWENQLNSTFKILIIMSMMRAVQPLELKAGAFFNLSMESFITIIKSSYSSFALLMTVTNYETNQTSITLNRTIR